jgi:N12 class adenine-specific DNA methylase/adenine-specific DNA methylase
MASAPYEPRGFRRPPRNYAQLDLFSTVSADSTKAAPETAAPETEATDAREDAARREDSQALADTSSADGRPIEQGPSAGADAPRDSGTDRGPPLRTDLREKDGLPGRVGDSDGGMGIATERGPPATIVRGFETEQEETPARDFRITAAHQIGEGSLREKALTNIKAIRTLKLIETENRDATESEKSILVRYAGWGAMPGAFRPYPSQEWQPVANQLRELLTKDEYEAARASTPNAHFTSPVVIEAMWQAMQRFGLTNGAQILEPSLGVGHFIGLMPDELAKNVRKTGVELDSITARIAQRLYPDSTVFAKGFEETPLPDNYFDAVIGNIPFGNYPVYDPAYRRQPALTRTIHNYFLAKSLDKLRAGGVMALITSHYTMDKQDQTIRRYLAERGDLLGAIRLPDTAFKANAGTEVTTDILFLQKREPGTPARTNAWLDLAPVETPDGPIFVNEYFAQHPEMMLGEMRLEGTMYRSSEATLTGELSPERMANALARLPRAIYKTTERERAPPDMSPAPPTDIAAVKDGAFAERDGVLVVRSGDRFEPAGLSEYATRRVHGMLRVRDAIRSVFQTQLSDAPEDQIVEARQRLNSIYDSFTRRFGPLSSRDNVKAFAGDPDQPLLLSLEIYDPENGRAAKTAIFERRTLERYKPVEHVESAAEALAVSLNETGKIDWPRMEQVTGRSNRELQHELGELVYRNPEGGEWETADRYLSGDVRAKLTTARSSATLDASYRRNVEALEAVQPPDLQPGDIEARLGSSWIPESDINAFVAHLVDTAPDSVRVSHAEAIATWTLEIDYGARNSVANTTTYGTARFRASDLIEDALNGRTPTAYDERDDGSRVVNQQETIAAREKQQQIKDRFREWIWEDPERATRLAREYNDRFNNLRLRTFDGSHLTFPGMVREQLRDRDLGSHQKNAVWRVLQSGSTLLAHVVGAGKTWTMAASAMELRRMGLAKKPMFVVPNHLVEQWGAEFLKLYPQARLFIAGKDHFSAGNRQRAMARIATGNYDAVIVSHRSFEFLPVSDELFNRFVNDQLEQLENAIVEAKTETGDTRRIVKELEKAKKRLAAKLKQRADRERKDNAISFEELGIDQLFVDEADAYKNLFYTTKMNRIAGLPNSDSNRAFDMFMKTRYIRELTGGRGVVFATGTPISNTMAEMYTMLRYLGPDLLQERGVEHFDAWAANFAEAVTSLELAPDGSGYRMHTRFAKFINLPELLSMFHTVSDVQTADMLNLPRPSVATGKPQVVAAPASEPLKAYIKTLTERAEQLRSRRVDPSEDNMLKITGDGRKAALDMRLVDAYADAHGDTKLGRAIERIRSTWGATRNERSTQLVFCDLSTPHPGRFNVYEEVRERLIAGGIPKHEIAFIHDADSDAAKLLLFNAVNAGRVRIVIGSTEKMGAGTNVQRRLRALHHLDAPWRPRDIEQREGRILRQGNLNSEIEIYRYVTEGSFDAYMWQTLETKARFIQQVMSGRVSVRTAEDVEGGALTYAEIKAIASGNPAVMEKVKIDTEIRKLDQLRAAHLNQQHNIRWQLRSLPDQISSASEALDHLHTDIATRDAHYSAEFTMAVGNQTFSGKGAREEAGRALARALLSRRDDYAPRVRATIKGFDILSRDKPAAPVPDLFIRGAGTYAAHINPDNPAGTIQSIEHTLRALDKMGEDERHRIEGLGKKLTDYQAQAGRPFEHDARFKQLLARQAQLNTALDLDKSDAQAQQLATEPPSRFLLRPAAPKM